MKKPFPHLSLVLGGAASGKSAFAERLTNKAKLAKTYIATAQSFDDEMTEKIARHREMRGQNWNTIEEPLDIKRAIQTAEPNSVILIDCLTLWLSNHLLLDAPLINLADTLLEEVQQRHTPIICVSNEAGLGVVPDNKLARLFRQSQGELNQKIAASADLVVNVTAGIPMVLKGQMPDDMT